MEPWQTPELEEIDMNAEIGGYQPDPDERGDETPPFVHASTLPAGPA
jgi:hypothetical protein